MVIFIDLTQIRTPTQHPEPGESALVELGIIILPIRNLISLKTDMALAEDLE